MSKNPKEAQSSEDAHEPPPLMDNIDVDDDTDSFGSDFGDSQSSNGDCIVGSFDQRLKDWQGLRSTSSGPSSSNLCPVCNSFRSSDDITCGSEFCVQKLKFWEGLAPRSPSTSSGNLCPVCNSFRSSDDITCGTKSCVQRLKFWEGQLPNNNNPRYSPILNDSSSYSAAVQSARSQIRAAGMCQVCHRRPRYSHNGKTYPTCGLTCAAKLSPSGRVQMCDVCRQQPKVVLNGRVYPHCSRSCRDKANAAKDTTGRGTGTCTTCLNCWKAPANIRKDEFCSDACRQTIAGRAPLLLEVPRGHSAFNEVQQEFKSAWTHRKAPCPSVKKIYMVCLPPKRETDFEDYGKKVSSTLGIRKTKVEFRWIPGLRGCPLSHAGMTTPCQSTQCQLCNVLRGTYVPQIFGNGILTTSLPRATQDYDRWAISNPRFSISKVVLLSKVDLGKVVELNSFQASSGPPHGANSHSRVEMDEIPVYTCEALRPVYLISYG